jgi:hypothetical protein
LIKNLTELKEYLERMNNELLGQLPLIDDRVLPVLKNLAQKEFLLELWDFVQLQNQHQVDIKRLVMLKSSLSTLTRA